MTGVQTCALPISKDEAGAVDWLRKLELSRRDFESERDRLSLHHGVQANPRDIVYSLMNQLLMKYGQPPNFDQLKMVYFQMALFLHEERRNPFKLKQEAIKSDLSKWRKQAEKGSLDLERNRVKVITCGSDSCAECRKLNGATFHLDEAFEKMPIPVRACAKWSEENSYGWCRCEYALIALHDEDELEPL